LELSGQIQLEKERKALVTIRSENARAEADVQAYAHEASLKSFKGLEPAVLQMLTVQSADPRLMVSMAFKELAQNAGRIGNLNISPELLETLLAQSQPQARKEAK
jgi:hypothetical protein